MMCKSPLLVGIREAGSAWSAVLSQDGDIMFAQTILEQTNRLLREVSVDCEIPILLLLTGSSGCGKTRLCQELKAHIDSSRAVIHHFDSIGVPPPEQMIAEFGSGEAWQRAKSVF